MFRIAEQVYSLEIAMNDSDVYFGDSVSARVELEKLTSGETVVVVMPVIRSSLGYNHMDYYPKELCRYFSKKLFRFV